MNDKKIIKFMKQIRDSTNNFFNYVNNIGNQCALTDRYIEEIIETSRKLSLEYNK